MARLNIEDDILTDLRFQALVQRLGGDLEKALGRLARFWWAAQKHWADNRSLIPKDEFDLGGFEHLIEVKLAVVRPEGVYARGATKRLEWYAQRIEAGTRGGQKSVEARNKKYGTADPHALRSKPEALVHSEGEANEKQGEASAEANAEAPQKRPEGLRNPLVPALALTPVPVLPLAPAQETASLREDTGHSASAPSSRGGSLEDRGKRPVKKSKAPDVSSPASHLWRAYAEAYRAKYGQEPVRNARVNSQCVQLVERLGAEAAIQVVRFYLTHNGSFYTRTVHSLGACLKDAEALHTQMLAGHRVSQSESQQKDRQQGNMQAFANVYQKLKAEGVMKDES